MTDPISLGIIKTLARPGGNVSGLTLQTDELVGKRIGLLHEIVQISITIPLILGYAASPAFPVGSQRPRRAAAPLR